MRKATWVDKITAWFLGLALLYLAGHLVVALVRGVFS